MDVSAETRVCTTVLADEGEAKGVTELIGPAGEVDSDAVEQMKRTIRTVVPAYEGVAICGTCPPGVAGELYAAARENLTPEAVLLLDAARDVEQVLRQGVHVLKVNAAEIMTLTDRENVLDAGRDCISRWDVPVVVVTAGNERCRLFTRQANWWLEPPSVDGFINPIGAGDCASAVLLHQLLQKAAAAEIAPDEAVRGGLTDEALVAVFRSAVAAASASCACPLPGDFDPAFAQVLSGQMYQEPATKI